MADIIQIIKCIDKWLEDNHQAEIAPPEANVLLDKYGLLKERSERSGQYLRRLLRDGKIPHAYRIGNKWHIPHSQGAIIKLKEEVNKKPISQTNPTNKGRRDSDEYYVVSLCNEILGMEASQQHTFDFLRGDASEGKQGRCLPVDAYYESLNLVIEYCESQHTESASFFDPKATVSGVSRGEQRKIYDQRRMDVLPQHGIKHVQIHYSNFGATKKIKRNNNHDIEVVKEILASHGMHNSGSHTGSK